MDAEGLTLYDLSPGKTLAGRYEIHEAHRQGGLSTAFEVVDLETREHCELQLFPGGLFDGPSQLEDFSSILGPWKRVSAPTVLRVLDIVPIHDAVLALVTALPAGDSLRARLKQVGRLSREEVVPMGLQLLEGHREHLARPGEPPPQPVVEAH